MLEYWGVFAMHASIFYEELLYIIKMTGNTLLISEKYKFIYYWIPKNACSTLKEWFLKIHDIKYKNNHDIHNIALYQKNNIRTSIVPNADRYFKFIVIRNPYKRIVSAYIYLYTWHNYSKELGDLSFAEFINKIYNDRSFLRDIHLTPQNSFYDIKINKIINIDNLDKEMKDICDELGIKIYPRNEFNGLNQMTRYNNETYKYNKNSYDIKFSEFEVGRYYSQEKFATYKQVIVPLLDSFYNDDIKKKVYEIYKDDFEIFNIQK